MWSVQDRLEPLDPQGRWDLPGRQGRPALPVTLASRALLASEVSPARLERLVNAVRLTDSLLAALCSETGPRPSSSFFFAVLLN